MTPIHSKVTVEAPTARVVNFFFFHYRCCRKPDLPVLKVSVYRACNLEFRAICELGIMVGEGTVKVAVKSFDVRFNALEVLCVKGNIARNYA